MSLDIYPAIDLKDGKAVRLLKGEMESAIVYGDALDFAKQFEAMGAKWLHIVDLNGAFAGEPKNIKQIEQILQHTHLQIQIGGGIRDEDCIKRYTQMGVKRVILGSMAMKNPQFVKEMAQIYPIVVGIDARNGKVAAQGWAEEGQIEANQLAKMFAGSGIAAIVCTDINRDGALSGINIDFTEDIGRQSQIYTIASGGFSNTEELEILERNPYIQGVIIGKAFYENKINLKDILYNFRN
ncbi:1-(5-phosphoribosyl)-5-[(5-phosphoribosylamino)methylideneamino]imidazole-4-carboxamide isomerase [Helicobacter sp. MIT 05-5293]|uniref:1-(5-phosphoribosyl)-5-[(5- phosphoribosylamino)methylideneamino]imidazole-4- carboxamide isomerase n=1 Tax=Helicobacter sp. MIT 05-5293 TaxID=1548149 RepID=UPI00051DD3F6|nr:1-(5-phosphoribosyl)-5-[(5-phosphoribosylamino)methylideneamino]imidazole-4-carboxamide isomerase [Helicobacter sp. MIT 05-5293]TLD81634.1 1-(5-phosphoribosyl)-5-[(5-phosphoribosylamino)methylideneamino]imidazole-4-carboxamide isomerase [Helicobacter sp. MIT 05-5293]